MKTKVLLVALLIYVLISCLISLASAEDFEGSFSSGYWRYFLQDDGNAELILYNGPRGNIVIPNELDGHPITSVRENPFWRNNQDYTVAVSDDHPYLTTIDGVLVGKDDHKLICYPGSLLATEYEIPFGITSIGKGAFYSNLNLKSIIIPTSVITIDDEAFYACRGVKSIIIPESVTSIGEYAFAGWDILTSVTIPDSLVHIGDGAFGDCQRLTEIVVSTQHTVYSSNEGVLFSKDGKTLHQFPAGKVNKPYIIPIGVTSIGNCAFYGCMDLPSVTIPNGVTSIGNRAFDSCLSMNSIAIPDSVTMIGEWAFASSGLTTVTIPNSVISIGDYGFSNCRRLTSISLSPGVKSIGRCAFGQCESLVSVTVPDSVTSIGGGAFISCSSLTIAIMPNSVTSIGINVFLNCPDVTVYVPVDSSWVNYCQSNNFHYIVYGTETIGEVIIPSSVTVIEDSAFFGCNSLTIVTLPVSVISIGPNAFAECSDIILNVPEDSYAEWYCIENKIPYIVYCPK